MFQFIFYAPINVLTFFTRTAHKTLADTHNALLSAIGDRFSQGSNGLSSHTTPDSSQGHLNPIPARYLDLNRQNAAVRFPDIKFWTQYDFTKTQKAAKKDSDILTVNQSVPPRGNARLKDGQNVAMRYAEQDDGSIISGIEAEAVRAHLRAIFNGMQDRLPKTWAGIGIADKKYVLSELYKAYPYFLLCFDEWKGDYLASRVLSTYHATSKKRAGRGVKIENDEDDQMEIGDSSHNIKPKEDFKP